MNNNQFFSFSRFFILIKNDLLLNYKKYLLTLLVVILLGYIFTYLGFPKYHSAHFEIRSYFNLFIVSWFALFGYIALSFPAFSNKTSRRTYLGLPASTFEKYSAEMLMKIILPIILYFAMYWVVTNLARFTVLSTFPNRSLNIAPFAYSDFFKVIFGNGINWLYKLSMFLLFANISLFMFVVRIFFNKNGLLKTIISAIAIVLLFLCCMVLFSHIFIPGTQGFNINVEEYEIVQMYDNTDIFASIILMLLLVALLPIGYYKLKEKKL